MGIKAKQTQRKQGLTVVKQALDSRKPIPIFFALPYKDILNKLGHPILLTDDTYADMLNLPGKDLDFLNAEGDKSSNAIIADFHQLLSIYVEDFDIFVSQLPADTRIQQASWGHELVKIENELNSADLDDRHYQQLLMMRQTILQEINIEKNVVGDIKHQEYTAVIYGKTIAALEKNRRDFIAHAGMAFTPEPVSLARKKMVMYQINNPGETLELEEK
ncbi:hypothetical protein [Leuconostoc rapi]|uniref:hypothetical protein n=1 Tax=Leuconostoc rapi TaxID=1406906 RepID=UPI00195F2106|nr:hypothetical protein [Leuconostoc rapi]MBM7435693.1 hypothetical protein [Leuconostoc rapi]